MRQRVLIVDDHSMFRRAARAVLEADGLEIVGEAPDGNSALELAIAARPDAVLLDIQLPDCDGFEVARRLARLKPPPIVVLVSIRDAGEYGHLVMQSAARGFIPKSELTSARFKEMLSV